MASPSLTLRIRRQRKRQEWAGVREMRARVDELIWRGFRARLQAQRDARVKALVRAFLIVLFLTWGLACAVSGC